MKLNAITIRGYKSIQNLDAFPLRNLNILIGANGAGKSNLMSAFRLLAALAQGNLQEFVQKQGGPDAMLFGGRRQTGRLEAAIDFGPYQYDISLVPTADSRLIFGHEEVRYRWADSPNPMVEYPLGGSHEESKLSISAEFLPSRSDVLATMSGWRVHHFDDTSDSAAVKQPQASNDNLRLKSDAANLSPYLARLKAEDPGAFLRIVSTIHMAAPFFGGFVVREPLPQTVVLEWIERGNPDTPYRAHMLSDGTLRFACLATLLLQPTHLLPDTIIIDEPELGLHPYAINMLAEMLKQVSATKQVIVSTQSVELLNNFEPEDVVVVDRQEGASEFRRLSRLDLDDWLEDYALGELWQRNILGGRPTFAGVRT